jgi:hypothetical protein
MMANPHVSCKNKHTAISNERQGEKKASRKWHLLSRFFRIIPTNISYKIREKLRAKDDQMTKSK